MEAIKDLFVSLFNVGEATAITGLVMLVLSVIVWALDRANIRSSEGGDVIKLFFWISLLISGLVFGVLYFFECNLFGAAVHGEGQFLRFIVFAIAFVLLVLKYFKVVKMDV